MTASTRGINKSRVDIKLGPIELKSLVILSISRKIGIRYEEKTIETFQI